MSDSSHEAITRMRSLSFLASSGLVAVTLFAQYTNVLVLNPPEKIAGKKGETVTAPFELVLKSGFHVNSNKPNEEYLIPLRLTWTDGGVQPVETIFPEPKQEKYAFSAKPVSVFSGTFKIQQKFKIGPTAGNGFVTGKLRYQACNDHECLPPKNIDIKVPLEVR